MKYSLAHILTNKSRVKNHNKGLVWFGSYVWDVLMMAWTLFIPAHTAAMKTT